ncbi:hypothetical protein [Leptospira bandrabouensis]|uniref:hypothetical protein n=1 Tax=Leptospira bandrabouensis TaxID=2484903 RepID=UPI001EEC75AB|nr:hypothetical protein [Leptospira bandrabouensis]MCG6154115.1 hypothetical protein [Leptospira bandrabouensis]
MKKYITYFYPVLFFLGYWNLHSYYSQFDLDISSYIDTFEIIFSFLKLINILTFSIFLITILSILIFFPISKIPVFKNEKSMTLKEEEENRWNIVKSSLKKVFRKRSNFFVRISNLLIAFIFTCITDKVFQFFLILFVFFKIYNNYTKPTHEYLGLIFFIEFIILIYFIKNFASNSETSNDNFLMFALLFISFIGFIYINNFAFASKIKAGIEDQKICFSYENELICSNSEKPFIGRTSNSLFLYDTKKNSTNIYFIKDTKNLEIYKKEILHIKW